MGLSIKMFLSSGASKKFNTLRFGFLLEVLSEGGDWKVLLGGRTLWLRYWLSNIM